MSVSPNNVSVIICAYTEARWDDLIAAVASLRQQTIAPRDVIIVVDHNPALLARAHRHFAEVAPVIVVDNGEQRGLSGARNSGIAAARGAIIAFLDDDAVAAPEWLERLTAGYADPRVVATGGKINPLWQAGRPAWFPREFDWVVGCTYKGMPERDAPVRNLIGCNMSFRREAFDAVGGFRSGIGRVGARPVGCEETELCIRVSQHWPDRVLLYIPSAAVGHHVPRSRGSWSYFRARCYAEGLSKAQVSGEVGQKDALSSETSYATRVLPAGVLRGMAQAVTLRAPAGFGRAAAIIFGLGATVAGYAVGRIKAMLNDREPQPGRRGAEGTPLPAAVQDSEPLA